jgi:dCMP deaminase
MLAPRSVPNRDDKYMGLAFWMASFSKDPNTQMGAVIISKENFPLGWGYNGPPRGIKDTEINWARPDKYDYIIHAEENAIDHSSASLQGATLYVTGKPCKKCMLRIITTGIKKVVFFNHVVSDKGSMFKNGEIGDKTDEIAKLGGVGLAQYRGNLNWMRDRIKMMELIGVFD